MRANIDLVVTAHAIDRYRERVGPLPYGQMQSAIVQEFQSASRIPKAIRKKISFWDWCIQDHGGRLSWNKNTGAVFVTKRSKRHRYTLVTVFSAVRLPEEQGILGVQNTPESPE